MQSHARVATAHAAKYMTQLAKHWSHKFEVTFDERQASIPLPMGPCLLVAGPDALDISIEASDAESLARMQQVVANHVQRFAFREPDLAFDWRSPSP